MYEQERSTYNFSENIQNMFFLLPVDVVKMTENIIKLRRKMNAFLMVAVVVMVSLSYLFKSTNRDILVNK